MSTNSSELPFSRPLALADIRASGTSFDLETSQAEATQMAAFLGINKLSKFSFSGLATSDDAGGVALKGKLGVTVTQECVVTLQPVRTRIDTSVERLFAANIEPIEEDHQLLEDEATVDPLSDPIDLGLIALEDIALSLPAYPRAQDADLEETAFAAPGIAPLRDDDVKPFAALAELRDKLEQKAKN